jgi:cob(I)alamin adenosyltransferase
MIHIYYGFGKGKTSTLNGSAVRAKSAGLKVAYVRFLKGRHTSENELLSKMGIEIENFHYSTKFTIEMSEEEFSETQKQVNKGLARLKELINNVDVLLVDEFLDLVITKLATENQIVNILKTNKTSEILISGHYKLDKIFNVADLITHYEAEKHYFDSGIKARKGIEF